MRFLSAPTEEWIKDERATLAAAASAGTSVTLTLKSNNGLALNDFIVVGYEGSELCELVQINQAVTAGTNVRVATLKFNHVADEPVVKYRFDKRKFYGATSATGSYTELTSDGSPKAISVDDEQGTSIEYSGTTYTYFKATYFNSQTSEETDIDDSDAVLGDETLRYTTLWAIRKHAGLAGNPFYSDYRLETKRKQAENEINSGIASIYLLPLTEVPALLGQICELLAAGYIDYEEFGKDGQGGKWLGEARALIKALGTGRQLLIGEDGTELTRNGQVGRLDGYPDSVDTDAANFSMNDRF